MTTKHHPLCSHAHHAAPAGALGEAYLHNQEVGGNPKATFDATAWDFGTCTYYMMPGDTFDGMAQLYLGSQPGDYRGPGGAGGINKLNQANTDNALVNAGKQNQLQAGTPIHMPQAACDAALAMWKTQCAAGAMTVWQNNACLGCVANSKPGDGSANRLDRNECYCIEGYAANPSTGLCDKLPPPAPGCGGVKVKDATGNCVCPDGTTDDGAGGCKSVAVPPKEKPKTGVTKAGMGGAGFWLIAAAVAAVGYTIYDQQKEEP